MKSVVCTDSLADLLVSDLVFEACLHHGSCLSLLPVICFPACFLFCFFVPTFCKLSLLLLLHLPLMLCIWVFSPVYLDGVSVCVCVCVCVCVLWCSMFSLLMQLIRLPLLSLCLRNKCYDTPSPWEHGLRHFFCRRFGILN